MLDADTALLVVDLQKGIVSAPFAEPIEGVIERATGELHGQRRAGRSRGGLNEGLRYVAHRPDLLAILAMLFLVGTFGLNFPIFISTMAVGVFRADVRGYGLLSSIMAVGTISGALLNVRRATPHFESLITSAAVWGRVLACGACTGLLALRGSSCGDRRRGTDLHQHHQQSDAAIDRAGDAWARYGATPRCGAGRHPDRCADRGLDRRSSRSSLGTGDRRHIRLRRCASRRLCDV
jgi:hypothetical protein